MSRRLHYSGDTQPDGGTWNRQSTSPGWERETGCAISAGGSVQSQTGDDTLPIPITSSPCAGARRPTACALSFIGHPTGR